jgi:Uncharacterized protein conserved in bacteria
MLNAFAFMATNPRDMGRADDPVGPENDVHIRAVAREVGFIVVAWGNGVQWKNRGGAVLDILGKVWTLALTRRGFPRHPLYVRGGTLPEVLTRRALEGDRTLFDRLSQNKVLVVVVLVAGLLGLPRTVFGEDLPWLSEHIGPVTDFILTPAFVAGLLLGFAVGLFFFLRARGERDNVLDELATLLPDYRFAISSERWHGYYRPWVEPHWLRVLRGSSPS